MSIIARIEQTIKSYAKGILSEAECVELIHKITGEYMEIVPVIDAFGLGPELDPEAYKS